MRIALLGGVCEPPPPSRRCWRDIDCNGFTCVDAIVRECRTSRGPGEPGDCAYPPD